MNNLKALETYFNDSIIIAKRQNPQALPMIRELKEISISHAQGHLNENEARNKMHFTLAKHNHDPNLIDACFSEANQIKSAAFKQSEFIPKAVQQKPIIQTKTKSPWASMLNSFGNNFNNKTSTQSKQKTAKQINFQMPSFENKPKTRPENTGFKMASFGKGLIIQPFSIAKEKKPTKGQGNNFKINDFHFGGFK